MTDQQMLDRLIAHLRGQVAELRRAERHGAAPDELADRKRVILRLQERMSYVVRNLVYVQPTVPT